MAGEKINRCQVRTGLACDQFSACDVPIHDLAGNTSQTTVETALCEIYQRTISTTCGITGGGNLTANRTFYLTCMAARTVKGNPTNSTIQPTDIQGTANQVLRVDNAGTSLGFGQINLSSACAVCGVLPVGCGGTNVSTIPADQLITGNTTNAIKCPGHTLVDSAFCFSNTGNKCINVCSTASGTAGRSLTVRSGSTTAGGTNIAGGDLYLTSGQSTGCNTSFIYLQTPTPGGSGTSLTSLATRIYISNSCTCFSNDVRIDGNFSVGSNCFVITAATGNTCIAGTLCSTGNLTVGANKFIVTAASGNTCVAGTLGVAGNTTLSGTVSSTGDFTVGADKFNVVASSGNTCTCGTLRVQGNACFYGTLCSTGNLTVGANCFVITAASGNTAICGTTEIRGITTLLNTLNVNNSTLATNQTTFNLVNTTATTVNFAGAATTLNVGNSTLGLGYTGTTTTLSGSTGNLTVNIGAGASTTGNTKNINLGTAGLSGSTTNINIGNAVGTSNVCINGVGITQPTSGALITLGGGKTICLLMDFIVQTGKVVLTGNASGASALTLPNNTTTINALTNNHVLYAAGANTIGGEAYLCPSRGGTGRGTLTACNILYGCGTNAVGLSSCLVFDYTNARFGVNTGTPKQAAHIEGNLVTNCAYGFRCGTCDGSVLNARIEYNSTTNSIDFVIG